MAPADCQQIDQPAQRSRPTRSATAAAEVRSSSGVRVAVEHPLGQRVSGEQHLGAGGETGEPVDHRAGEEVEVGGLVRPRLDADVAHAVLGGRLGQTALILADRRTRVVRSEDEPDDPLDALSSQRRGGVLDERRRVLLAQHNPVPTRCALSESGRDARPLRLGALGERRGAAECGVAGGEVGQLQRRRRPAAADVGVVGLDVVR